VIITCPDCPFSLKEKRGYYRCFHSGALSGVTRASGPKGQPTDCPLIEKSDDYLEELEREADNA